MDEKVSLESSQLSREDPVRSEEGRTLPLPLVSVVMPIRNEAAFIERSLGAVLSQDYPKDLLEILIADGMSTDGTREIINRLSMDHPEVRLLLIDNDEKFVSTGFNRALVQSHGDVIVRVDGHTVISQDYVRECINALQRSGADNVGGRMEPVGEGKFGLAVALATTSPFGVGGARFHYSCKEEWVDTVYLGAWPRNVFKRIGLFDEEQVRNQDDEFNYRLLEAGGSILLTPKIRSTYFNRVSIRTLFRQYFQYGFWKVRVIQKHLHQIRWRQIVPPVFVSAILALLALSPFSEFARFGLVTTAGSYLFANITASAVASRRGRWRLMPFLLIVFPVLHISYGLGFLIGLGRFWNRWGDRTRPRYLA